MSTPDRPTTDSPNWLDQACLAVADGATPETPEDMGEIDPDAAAMLRQIAGLSRVFADGMKDPADVEPPFRWGRLSVECRIGHGSFGTVYRAHDPDLDRHVALKLIGPQSQARDPASLITEARRHAQVRHPNILAIHGASVEDGRAGFWMDLLSGRTLDERVRAGPPLTGTELHRLFTDLTRALLAISDQGLSHGDLKATNVWVDDNGRAIVMDFGAAAPADNADGPRFGSPATMAPELFFGKPASAPTEVFSLGATLCFAATGEYPAPGVSFGEIRDAYVAGRPVNNQLLQRVPASLRALVDHCLQSDPAARPALPEILEELHDIESRPARRFRRAMVSALVASLTAGLAISLFLLDRSRAAQTAAENARVEAQTSKDFLVDAVRDFSPISGAGFSEISEVLDFLGEFADERLAETPIARGELKVVVGTRQSHFGEVEAGLQLAYEGLAELRSALGENTASPLELVNALNTLADEERRLDHISEAEVLAREALALIRPVADSSDDLALTEIRIRGLYSNILESLGRWREALTTQQAIFAAREALLGHDDPRMAVEHNNLAARYSYLGRHDEALFHFRQALQLLLADDTLRRYPFAMVSHSIAAELTFTGQFEEAEQSIVSAIQAYGELDFGENTQPVQLLETLRATRHRALGQFDDAIRIYRSAINTGALSGTALRNIHASLGRTFLLAGRFSEALDSYRLAHQTERPDGHPTSDHLDAAIAFSEFRAGLKSREHAAAALRQAASVFIEQGYTGTFEYQDLWRWGISAGVSLPPVIAKRPILPPVSDGVRIE